MNIEILKDDKNDVELNVNNITVAEVLRVYLEENGADFAAWKRAHPSQPALMKIKAGNVKKTVNDSVNAIKKDCDALISGLKK